MSGEELLRAGNELVLDVALSGTALLLTAGLAALILRRAPAALRHLVWLGALGGLVLVPVLAVLVPGWRLDLPAIPPRKAAATFSSAPTPGERPASIGTVERVSSHLQAAGPASSGSDAGALGAAPRPAVSSFLPLDLNPPPHPAPGPYLQLFPVLWLAGALAVAARFLLRLRTLRTFAGQCGPFPNEVGPALLEEAGAFLRVNRPIRLLQAPADQLPVGPMTWGWSRPVVVLPPGAILWSKDQMRSVLLHEVAHIRRGDWPAYLLAEAVCALFWFHPLAWWAAARLRAESELACDDQVLTAGVPATEYAHALLEVIRSLRNSPESFQVAISMAQGPKLEARLRAILDARRRRGTVPTVGVAVAVGLAALAALPASALRVRPAPLLPRSTQAPQPVRIPGVGYPNSTRPTGDDATTPRVDVTVRNPASPAGKGAVVEPSPATAVSPTGKPAQAPAPNQAELNAARRRVLELLSYVSDQEERLARQKVSPEETASNLLLQRLLERRAQHEEELITLRTTYIESAPEVRDKVEALEVLKRRIDLEQARMARYEARRQEERARIKKRILVLKVKLAEAEDRLAALLARNHRLPGVGGSATAPATPDPEPMRSALEETEKRRRIEVLASKIAVAEAELAKLRTTYGPKHPRVQQTEAVLVQLRVHLQQAQSASGVAAASSPRETRLRAELGAVEQQLRSLEQRLRTARSRKLPPAEEQELRKALQAAVARHQALSAELVRLYQERLSQGRRIQP